jgi:hypothetical protein
MTVQLPSAADWLNSSCFCITLDRDTLHAAMEREAGDPEFSSRYIRPREQSTIASWIFHWKGHSIARCGRPISQVPS